METAAISFRPLDDGTRKSQRPAAQPLVALFLAVSSGVVLDASVHIPQEAWLAITVFALAASTLRPARVNGRAMIFVVAFALAAAWHQQCTRRFAIDDVGNYAVEERRICRVRGCIASEPLSERAGRPQTPLVWATKDATNLRLNVEALADVAGGWRPASGLLAVHIQERTTQWRRGDWVEVEGWLARPPEPMNEGEFDYRAHLLRQRVRATLNCKAASAVQRMDRAPDWSVFRWRDQIAASARRRLQAWLPDREAGLAEAALIGTRTAMRRDEVEPFLNSGTLHLLVVSGWHVAVLARALMRLANLLPGSRVLKAALTLLAVWAYTFLTGNDPPAVRAAVLVTMVLIGVVVRRGVQPLNTLAASGLFIAAMDPTQLFQTGAQLSFLAVFSLLLFPDRLLRLCNAPTDDADPPTRSLPRRFFTNLGEGLLTSLAVWLVTAPLVAHRFHLFSPASIWLTVFLERPLEYAIYLCTGLIAVSNTGLGAPLAWFCKWILVFLSQAAAWSEALPASFFYTAGPPGWWVAIFYALLILPWCRAKTTQFTRRHLAVLLLWIIVGAGEWTLRRPVAALEVHQLAVGHGNCAVVRTTDGRTILIDCGSLGGPLVAERVIAPWLWSHGLSSIDAVLLSHADVDHFNALPALAQRFSIGAVYAPPQFAQLDQPAVAFVHRDMARRGVKLRFVWEGDVFSAGAATLTVVQPAANARGRSDNSNSMVVEVHSGGRTLLATADLADEGLSRLLARPRIACDVLIVPHHGGRTSNPPALAEWALPRVAVSSQTIHPGRPLQIYDSRGAVGLRTDQEGTVSVRWGSDGLEVRTFRTGRRILLPDGAAINDDRRIAQK